MKRIELHGRNVVQMTAWLLLTLESVEYMLCLENADVLVSNVHSDPFIKIGASSKFPSYVY